MRYITVALALSACDANVERVEIPAGPPRFSCGAGPCPGEIAIIRDSYDGRCWAYTQSVNRSAAFGPIPCEVKP